MSEIATAFVRIRPNTTGFRSETEAGVRGAFSGIGKLLTGALAVGAGVEFGKDIIESAAQVQKSIEVIKTQFGGAAAAVLDFSTKGATALGISAKTADAASAKFGILFHNLGIGNEQAAQMTLGFEKLAGSLSSIKGVDASSALNAVTLAAAGNTRGLKQLGVVIDTTQIKYVAYALGLTKNLSQPLTNAQKAVAIYTIATQKLGDFQSEAAAHSKDLFDLQAQLAAEWSNMKDELGTALLPTMVRFATFLADNLPAATKKAKEEFNQFVAILKTVTEPIGGVENAIKGLLVLFATEKVLAFANAIKRDLVANGLAVLGANAEKAAAASTAQAGATAKSGTAAVTSSTSMERLGISINGVAAASERLTAATDASVGGIVRVGTTAADAAVGTGKLGTSAAGAAGGLTDFAGVTNEASAAVERFSFVGTATAASFEKVGGAAATVVGLIGDTGTVAVTTTGALSDLAGSVILVVDAADRLDVAAGTSTLSLARIGAAAATSATETVAAVGKTEGAAGTAATAIDALTGSLDAAVGASDRLNGVSSTVAAGIGQIDSTATAAVAAVGDIAPAAVTAAAALGDLAGALDATVAAAGRLDIAYGTATGSIGRVGAVATGTAAEIARGVGEINTTAAALDGFSGASNTAAAASERLDGATLTEEGTLTRIAAAAAAVASTTGDITAAAGIASTAIASLTGVLDAAAAAAERVSAANATAAGTLARTSTIVSGATASTGGSTATVDATSAAFEKFTGVADAAAAASGRLGDANAVTTGTFTRLSEVTTTASGTLNGYRVTTGTAITAIDTLAASMNGLADTAGRLDFANTTTAGSFSSIGGAAATETSNLSGTATAADTTAAALDRLSIAGNSAAAAIERLNAATVISAGSLGKVGASAGIAEAAVAAQGGAAAKTATAAEELTVAHDAQAAAAVKAGIANTKTAAYFGETGKIASKAAGEIEGAGARTVESIGASRAAAAGLISTLARFGEFALIAVTFEIAVNRKKLASFFDTSNFLGSHTVDEWVARNIPGARWLDNTIFGEKTVNRLIGAQANLSKGTSAINKAFTGTSGAVKDTFTGHNIVGKDAVSAFDGVKSAASATASFMTGTVVPAFEKFGDKLGPIFQAVARLGHAAFADLKEIGSSAAGTFHGIVSSFSGVISTLGSLASSLHLSGIFSASLDAVKSLWSDFGGSLTGIVRTALGAVRQIVVNGIDAIRGALDLITGILTGNWGKAWDGLKTIVSSALNDITTIVTAFGKIIVALFEDIWKSVEKVSLLGLQKVLELIGKVPTEFKVPGVGKVGFKNPAAAAAADLQNTIDGIFPKKAKAPQNVFKPVIDSLIKQQQAAQKIIDDALKAKPIGITGGLTGEGTGSTSAITNAAKAQAGNDAAKVKAVADAKTNLLDLNKELAKLNSASENSIRTAQNTIDDLQQSIAQQIVQEGRDIYDAVNQAKTNLGSIMSTLSSDIGAIIDAPLNALQNKLGLAQSKNTLENLRRSVLLPGGKTLSTDPTKAIAQLKAISAKASAVTKPAIDAFLLQYQQAALGVQTAQATITKTNVDKSLGSLVSEFNNGKLTAKQFSEKVQALLKKDGISFNKIGKLLGGQFLDGFKGTIKGLLLQAEAIAAAPNVKGVGAGNIPSIIHPLWVLQNDQRQIARDSKTLLKDQKNLAQKQLTAQKNANTILGQIRDAEKIIADSAKSNSSDDKNPGKKSKTARGLSGTTG